MEKMQCVINKVLDFQLGSGTFSGHTGASTAGFDLMLIAPFMAIPFLMILIAGLWMMDQYRRKTSV